MHAFHRNQLTLLALLGGAGCASAPPPPVVRPIPSTARSPGANATALTTQWQSMVILDRRDSLVLTLPDGSKQLQRLGRLAYFTLTLNGTAFSVRLDTLQVAPASPEASREAVGTSWSGWLGAFGRIENLSISRGGILVEELTTTVVNLLPRLPRAGARGGDRWTDTTKQTIRVQIFKTDDQRTARWQVGPATDRDGLRVVPVHVREEFEQVGRGSTAGRKMAMTAQGSRSATYYVTADGRLDNAVVIDSAAMLITIPGSQQSIPTMQYGRTVIRYRPLATRAPND